MERKIIRIFSIILAVVLGVCLALLFGIRDPHHKSEVLAKEIQESRAYKQSVANRMRDEMENAEELASFASKGQVRIDTPTGVDTNAIEYNADPMNRFIQIAIPGVSEDYFDDDPIMGSVSVIDDFAAYEEDGVAYFDITLNDIYECVPTQEKGYLYLNFVDPHEIYDYVVVVDAGHGGRDVGAVQGNVQEKNIDLDIAMKLKEILDTDTTIKTYYTRETDTNPTLTDRVKLANDAEADIFLSVHNNSLSGFGKNSTEGTQVLYYASDSTGKSKEFADICLDKLCGYLGSTNRGLVNGDDILIIHNSKGPVALVEVGFLSNPTDLKNLQDDNYQKTCAQALYDSIKEMLAMSEAK